MSAVHLMVTSSQLSWVTMVSVCLNLTVLGITKSELMIYYELRCYKGTVSRENSRVFVKLCNISKLRTAIRTTYNFKLILILLLAWT